MHEKAFAAVRGAPSQPLAVFRQAQRFVVREAAPETHPTLERSGVQVNPVERH
jgi:hypothetical protein